MVTFIRKPLFCTLYTPATYKAVNKCYSSSEQSEEKRHNQQLCLQQENKKPSAAWWFMLQYQKCAYVRWHGMYQAPSEGCRYIEEVIHCVLLGHLRGNFRSNRHLQKKIQTFFLTGCILRSNNPPISSLLIVYILQFEQ